MRTLPRTLPPIFHPSFQPHATPGKREEALVNPLHPPFPVYCELPSCAKVAGYPSPPMSGSPSPSRQRCTNPASETIPATSSQFSRSVPGTSPRSSNVRANPAIFPRPLLSQNPPRYLPPPAHPPWPLVTAAQALPPLVSYATAHFDSSARPPSIVDRFLPSSEPITPLESPQITTSPSYSPHSRIIRKGKSHVASACANCKKAHLSCDIERPCGRCVASGKQETCKDVPHKKRGRPKLKTDASAIGSRRTSALEPSRPISRLQGYGVDPEFMRNRSPRDLDAPSALRAYQPDAVWSHAPAQAARFPARDEPLSARKPIAFMDEDLRIVQMNQAFRDSIGPDSKDRDLCDLVSEACRAPLQTIRSSIMNERIRMNPSYLPPVLPAGESDVIPRVEEVNLNEATRGYTDHTATLEFRYAAGIPSEQFARLRLALTDVAFIVLELVTTTAPSFGFYPNHSQPSRPRDFQHLLPQPPQQQQQQQTLPPSPAYLASNYAAPYSHTPPSPYPPYPPPPPSAYASAPHSPFPGLGPLSTTLPAGSPIVSSIAGSASASASASGLYHARYEPAAGYFPPTPAPREPAYTGYQPSHAAYQQPPAPPPPLAQLAQSQQPQPPPPPPPSAEQRLYHLDPHRNPLHPTQLPPMRADGPVPAPAYSVGAAEPLQQQQQQQRPRTRQREETPPEERAEREREREQGQGQEPGQGQGQERRGHKRRRTEMDIRKVLDE